MVDTIEISPFKIGYVLLGLISFFLPWARIIASASYLFVSVTVTAEYNFLGDVTRVTIGALEVDTSKYQRENDFTLYGALYLIGFLVTLIVMKIDQDIYLLVLDVAGLFLMIGGLSGYVSVLNDFMREISRYSLYTPYASIDYESEMCIGFYCAVITIILVVLELISIQSFSFKIDISHPLGTATTMRMQSPSHQAQSSPRGVSQESPPSKRYPFCPKCGTKRPETAQFCPRCGLDFNTLKKKTSPVHKQQPPPKTPIELPRKGHGFCAQCNSLFDDPMADFCPNCGSKLNFKLRSSLSPEEQRKIDVLREQLVDHENCPLCGKYIMNPTANFCDNCGKILKENIPPLQQFRKGGISIRDGFCPFCDSQIVNPDAVYCDNCGIKLRE